MNKFISTKLWSNTAWSTIIIFWLDISSYILHTEKNPTDLDVLTGVFQLYNIEDTCNMFESLLICCAFMVLGYHKTVSAPFRPWWLVSCSKTLGSTQIEWHMNMLMSHSIKKKKVVNFKSKKCLCVYIQYMCVYIRVEAVKGLATL